MTYFPSPFKMWVYVYIRGIIRVGLRKALKFSAFLPILKGFHEFRSDFWVKIAQNEPIITVKIFPDPINKKHPL